MKDIIEKQIELGDGFVEIWIKDGVKQINAGFYREGTKVASIKIPNSVKRIFGGAFGGFTNLKEIILPESLELISNYAFANCVSLTSITIPQNVEKIGHNAFKGCENLTSIVIPQSVKQMGSMVFRYCDNLRDVTIQGDFDDANTFDCCWYISSININGKKSPRFYCKSLKTLTIGMNLEEFDRDNFESCKSLKFINVDSKNKNYDSRNNCNAIIETRTNTLVLACLSTKIPDGVKIIKKRAFEDCGRIRKLVLPASLEVIESIPENVKTIIVPKGMKREFKKKLPRYYNYVIEEQ